MGIALSRLATDLGSSTQITVDTDISNIASLNDATEGDISFLSNVAYASLLSSTKASAVLVKEEYAGESSPATLIVVDNPNIAFSRVAELLGLTRPTPPQEISERATIASTANLEEGVSIQAGAVIAEEVSIGAGSIIYPNVYLGDNVSVGKNCVIYPNVTVMDGCTIGDNVIINAGSVIGSDGFGFDLESPGNTKIPQIGNVVIEESVEIGANVTIDRARFGSTRIGAFSKIDNLVQIAHNVVIGSHSVIVSQSGIAGSTRVGNGVIAGGRTAIAGHLHIADGTIIAGRSGVTKSIENPGTYGGFPAQSINLWRKDIANIRSLSKIKKSLKSLTERIIKIEHSNPKND